MAFWDLPIEEEWQIVAEVMRFISVKCFGKNMLVSKNIKVIETNLNCKFQFFHWKMCWFKGK